MARWIWERPDWPEFDYDPIQLRALEDRYIHLGGVAVGTIHHQPEDQGREQN